MTLRKMNILIALLMAVALLMLLIPVIAYADHHKHHDDDITIDNVLTGGDNTASNVIAGSRSYGIGMGDVDIADYYRSHQALFLQWTTPNLLALAIYYDSTGLYESAAVLKCSVKQVRKALGRDCEARSQIDPIALPRVSAPLPPPIADDDEDDDERYDALYARISEIEAKGVQDKAKAEKAAKRANASAVRAKEREQQTAQQDIEAYREIISE